MATRQYGISLWVLKNISQVSAAKEWNIFQHEKRNFVSPRDRAILFLLYKIHKCFENHKCLQRMKKLQADSSKMILHVGIKMISPLVG